MGGKNIIILNENSRLYTRDGSVDINDDPVLKSETGNWRACPFILGNECCEHFAFFGIGGNLVTYLTNNLHEGNVPAARNVTTWLGTYQTIATFSIIYFMGMSTLTLSASVPAFKPPDCVDYVPFSNSAQYAIFFFGLYLIALGTGGIKPCISSFGADQFDDTDPKERVTKGFLLQLVLFFYQHWSTLIVWIQ
uniref:Uncharacterized protein n=1 Tax=Solanum lycopersicum TaxID=4081 RepID=A0A3Q7JVX4_SOLLC